MAQPYLGPSGFRISARGRTSFLFLISLKNRQISKLDLPSRSQQAITLSHRKTMMFQAADRQKTIELEQCVHWIQLDTSSSNPTGTSALWEACRLVDLTS